MNPDTPRRRTATRLALVVSAALLLTGFVALGSWQLRRLAWKLDLIDRVEQRVHAAPQPAPGTSSPSTASSWPLVTAAADEYRHVSLRGRFLHAQETLVQAVTERGPGWWLLTPLQLPDGRSVLVNRGFVAPEARERVQRPDGEQGVNGLLRLSEPGGGFLRRNDPAARRWFSRDVQAIAAAQGLQAAPYFVDADADPAAPEAWPIGGLTVVQFANNHLQYALTWYALALMVAGAAWMLRPGGRWHAASRGTETGENRAHDAPLG